ncbi:tRNA (guanine-N(7)-)-methyltransferase [Bernardetia litoralis DSM 6794]|uniref:tRNA (guanine-N(7)-)-methyltransferase n=1 Tax=Bernardetia litoralis (strain ATCC 23117 / DSM 6794 / NBRC 15988 / NCIMB 1366 / Fx l1 / Sio-4) TaxID=880071 RepID=I4AIF3_BERLS|nr:tRNA (guanosine(46)-N7)-methyltransferase TrmB [Bernardetia litoralis]AFM03738.1 tRNA (guanine-N(7)-)-methyltransferase [Bernardetia litoralis DSM 6794]
MARKKMMRFEENLERYNVLQSEDESYKNLKGNWNKIHFPSPQPIVLELACGYGEYSVGLGKVYPNKNFVGVDVKGDRLWRGSTEALNNDSLNVAFLRAEIQQLDTFFEEDEVSEIWVVHPDPRPRKRDIKRRLTNSRFLDMYKKILKKGGTVHIKTDDDPLYDYTIEELSKYKIKNLLLTRDLHNSPLHPQHHDIRTRYENRAQKQGLKINYLRFEFE